MIYRIRQLAAALIGVCLAVSLAITVPADPALAAVGVRAISVTANGGGYASANGDGVVSAFGSVTARGSPSGFTGRIAGLSVTADGQGYAAISSTGQVYAYGTVRYRGNPTGFSGGIVGIGVTADGQGYAAISSTGQVYAYGTVRYRGNPTGYSGSITGIGVTGDGQGYAAVSSAAQVYAYGTVQHRGNPYDFFGTATGIAVSSGGYAVVTDQGQVHAYGNVTFRGDFDDVAVQNSAQHLRAARYVNWTYGAGGGFWNVDQTVYVVVKPRQTYWSLNWGWMNTSQSSGGYMGLQTDGNRFNGTTGDTAIFSLWNANGSRGTCGSFSGEGNGLSCRIPYTIYSDGNSYRLRVWRLETDAQGQWWGAWIRDSRRGDVHIGDLRVPATASLIANGNDFSEYYGTRVSCDAVPLSVVNWAYPTANNGAVGSTPQQPRKASCTGGTARATILADGTRVVQAQLGGPR